MSRLIGLLCLSLFLQPWLRGAPHRYRLYPNPAIEISAIAPDALGFLWLAAADGLYRFNGLHYDRVREFPFSSARVLATTSDGALWAGGIDGLVRYRDRFDIVHRNEVRSLAAVGDRVFAASNRLWEFGPNAKGIQHYRHNPRRDLFADPSGVLWYTCESGTAACSAETSPSVTERPRTVELSGTYDQAVIDTKGHLWTASGTEATEYIDGRPHARLKRKNNRTAWRSGALLPGAGGQLWFLGDEILNLLPGVVYSRQPSGPQNVPTAGFQDERGHLWVAMRGEGLIEWIPDPDWDRWSSSTEFKGHGAVQIAKDPRAETLVAAGDSLSRLDPNRDRWSAIREGPEGYAVVFPFAGEFLVSTRNDGLWRVSRKGAKLEQVAESRLRSDWIREIVKDKSGQIWLASWKSLFRLNGSAGTLKLVQEPTRKGELDIEIHSEGRIWVGNRSGIAWRDDDGRWHEVVTEQPLQPIVSLSVGGTESNPELWVAYRQPGKFSRLRYESARWRLTDFSSDNGYGPADTLFLKQDSRGWIWRGSSQGLHVSNGHDTAPEDWILLTAANGFNAEIPHRYGFFEDTDGSVWIAGAEGVTHFRPDASWFETAEAGAKPKITRIELDGLDMPASRLTNGALPSSLTSLKIQLGALRTPAFREHAFAYRLLPEFSDWRVAAKGLIEVKSLSRGVHRLEVTYNSSRSVPALIQQITVGSRISVPSWRWWLAVVLGIVSALALLIRFGWMERLAYRASKLLYLRRLHRGHPGVEDDQEPTSSLPEGRVLGGKYKIVHFMSKGGFSTLYEAQSLNGGPRRVAIKVLNEVKTNHGWLRDRFAVEVATLQAIKHPGVVEVTDWWIEEDGEPCLVMPFLDGSTLRDSLRVRRLSPRQAARIIRQVGSALGEVHARGIVHRDLKPENIMLVRPGSSDEQAIVIDFGTAALRGADGELAVTTMLAGSLHYMAPEQLTGHYSPAVDVYSFCAIIMEILTGRRLSEIGAHSSSELFFEELVDLLAQSLTVATARQAAMILSPAFSPQPERRPVSVKAWACEIADLLDQA